METFVQESCCECGVNFGIPSHFHTHLKRNKQTFYCPNGHSMSYTKSTAQILQEKLDREIELKNQIRRERDNLELENKKLAANQKPKVKKKVKGK